MRVEDILIQEWSGDGVLGGMVKVVDEEQWLSISDDDVNGEEEPGDCKGRTEGCYYRQPGSAHDPMSQSGQAPWPSTHRDSSAVAPLLLDKV